MRVMYAKSALQVGVPKTFRTVIVNLCMLRHDMMWLTQPYTD